MILQDLDSLNAFIETAIILHMYLNYRQDLTHMEIERRFAFMHKCQFSALPLADTKMGTI